MKAEDPRITQFIQFIEVHEVNNLEVSDDLIYCGQLECVKCSVEDLCNKNYGNHTAYLNKDQVIDLISIFPELFI